MFVERKNGFPNIGKRLNVVIKNKRKGGGGEEGAENLFFPLIIFPIIIAWSLMSISLLLGFFLRKRTFFTIFMCFSIKHRRVLSTVPF